MSADIDAIRAALAAVPSVPWTAGSGHVYAPETDEWRAMDINCNAAMNKLVGRPLARYIAACHPKAIAALLDALEAAQQAAPAAQPMRQPLTEAEIAGIVREESKGSAIRRDGTTSLRIARAIERAHGIGDAA